MAWHQSHRDGRAAKVAAQAKELVNGLGTLSTHHLINDHVEVALGDMSWTKHAAGRGLALAGC